MKTLHQELTDIILKVALAHHDDISMADEDNASKAAGAVIEKIVKSLPEKIECSCAEMLCVCGFGAWNNYHDTLKDLLTEGKETK